MGHDPLTLAAPSRHKFSVEDFIALDDAGVFLDKGRFELIEGEIYKKSPLHRPHARAQTTIIFAIMEAIRAAGLDLEVLGPASMRLGAINLPEPDIIVACLDNDAKFVERDVARIAIEISDSSRKHDLVRKASLYARHGIPEYWVIDLRHAQLHQMSDPTTKGYATIAVHPFGTRITSATVPAIHLDTVRLA